MVRVIPYLLAIGLLANQSDLLRMSANPENGLWVDVCGSGQGVWFDLSGNQDEPPLPVHTKACHAICCTKKQASTADKVKKKAA